MTTHKRDLVVFRHDESGETQSFSVARPDGWRGQTTREWALAWQCRHGFRWELVSITPDIPKKEVA